MKVHNSLEAGKGTSEEQSFLKVAEECQPSPKQRGSGARTAGIFLQTPRDGGGDVALGFTLSYNNHLNEQRPLEVSVQFWQLIKSSYE